MASPRFELVAREELTYEELLARLPGGAGHLQFLLIQRPSHPDFLRLIDGQPIHPGDRVVTYRADPARIADLDAINACFNAAHYPASDRALWPDEAVAIAAWLPSAGARVLEICVGAGRITRHLAGEGNLVIGLDNSPPCLAAAHRRDGDQVRYVAGDAAALPFPDHTFDAAVCFENSLGVLFAGRSQVVEELVRVTRPGGFLALGFREVAGSPPGHLHSYFTDDGYIELAHTFDRAQVAALLDTLAPHARARLGERTFLGGGPRPWGGCTFYLRLGC